MLRFSSPAAAVVLLIAAQASAQPAAPTNEQAPPPELSAEERAFAEAMSGAALVGNYTVGDEPGPPKPERYELGEVRKVGGGRWLLPTRIRYGDHDLTLPITLPVAWAGDTAVIVVDNVGIPGLGVFSARVLIHDGRYAGYWRGAGHGGHLFGVVEQPGADRTNEQDESLIPSGTDG